jgi:hypothetical protein
MYKPGDITDTTKADIDKKKRKTQIKEDTHIPLLSGVEGVKTSIQMRVTSRYLEISYTIYAFKLRRTKDIPNDKREH